MCSSGSLVGVLGGTHISNSSLITGLANRLLIYLIFLNRLGECSRLQLQSIIKMIHGTFTVGLKSNIWISVVQSV